MNQFAAATEFFQASQHSAEKMIKLVNCCDVMACLTQWTCLYYLSHMMLLPYLALWWQQKYCGLIFNPLTQNLSCFLLFPPSEEDGEHEKKKIWYYSTKAQLEELMECLDKEYWEMDLYVTLEEMKEEVQAHMDITEDLTNKARGNNKAYLTAVNGTHLILSESSLEVTFRNSLCKLQIT